jgi:hypothetical protein
LGCAAVQPRALPLLSPQTARPALLRYSVYGVAGARPGSPSGGAASYRARLRAATSASLSPVGNGRSQVVTSLSVAAGTGCCTLDLPRQLLSGTF